MRGFGKRWLCAAAAAALAIACAAPAHADLSAKINAALSSKYASGMKLGVYIAIMPSGKVIFARRADDLFTPASNEKVITTVAALHHLGADFQFETLFYIDGQLAGGVLKGDLVVQGDGDPNISGRFHNDNVTYWPQTWAKMLYRRGIRTITGDLVLDDTIFDRQFICPTWPSDQIQKWYEAPVAGLSFNDNCLDILVSAPANGKPARVTLAPDTSFIKLMGRVMGTSSKATAKSQPLIIARQPGTNEVTVKGTWLVGRPEERFFISIDNPPMFFGAVMADELKRAGITLQGTVRLAKPGLPRVAAKDRRVQIIHNSGLIETIAVCNKNSQNFYAEQLLKRAGAKCFGTGSFDTGAKAASAFLEAIGIPAGAFKVADGSGMSRENKFSPRQFVTVLSYAFNSKFADDFVDSLALSGIDHTLRHRLNDPAYRGKIVAKTGTLDGVVALSGYAFNRGGEVIAFSILANDTHGNWNARKVMDDICKALVDEKIDAKDSAPSAPPAATAPVKK